MFYDLIEREQTKGKNMENKQSYSLGRFEDGVAAAIFVAVAFVAGIATLFKSTGNALKQKFQQVQGR